MFLINGGLNRPKGEFRVYYNLKLYTLLLFKVKVYLNFYQVKWKNFIKNN